MAAAVAPAANQEQQINNQQRASEPIKNLSMDQLDKGKYEITVEEAPSTNNDEFPARNGGGTPRRDEFRQDQNLAIKRDDNGSSIKVHTQSISLLKKNI